MKLALASLIAFLFAYAAGGLIFAPTNSPNNLFDSKREDPENAGTSVSAMGTGGSTKTTGLASERAFLERIAEALPEHLEEIYLEVLRDRDRGNAVAKHWAEVDPEGMFASLLQIEETSPDRHYAAHYYLFRMWPASDPDAAIAAAHAFDKALPNRFDALETVIGGLMESNPKAALAFLKQHPEETPRLILPGWAADDPAGAAELFADVIHTKRFSYLLQRLASSFASADPESAMAWAASLDWTVRSRAQFLVARQALDDGDLTSAGALLADPAFRRSELGGEFGTDYASKLAQTNPAAALAWATENLSGTSRVNALYRVIDKLAAEDLTAALSFHENLPPGRIRESVASQLAGSWAKHDRDAAIAWADGELEGDAKRRATREIAEDWLKADAPAALAFAAEHPDAQATYYGIHAGALAKGNQYDKALEWIASLPESDARTSVASSSLAHWTYYNPAKASAYVESLPPGADRELGIAAVAARYFTLSESRALDWVRSLPSGDLDHVVSGIENQNVGAKKKQRILEAIAAFER